MTKINGHEIPEVSLAGHTGMGRGDYRLLHAALTSYIKQRGLRTPMETRVAETQRLRQAERRRRA